MVIPTSFNATNPHKCHLFLNKYSLRGVVADYIIEFQGLETILDTIVEKTYDLFQMLCEQYSGTQIKARLIAECEFLRLNSETGQVSDVETYHFASYSADWVDKTSCMYFYEQHMQKIASRMDEFNKNGSSLKLNRIKHIHIAITACT